jgi:hypothetical protein
MIIILIKNLFDVLKEIKKFKMEMIENIIFENYKINKLQGDDNARKIENGYAFHINT